MKNLLELSVRRSPKMTDPRTLLFLLVRVFFASFFIFLLMANFRKDHKSQIEQDPSRDELTRNWCRVRNERVDVKSKLKPCNFDISWNSRYDDHQRERLATDPVKSAIIKFNIQPAGEFSSFIIQTKTSDGKNKTFGGDSWRIMIRGRSSVAPTIFDLVNGQYEVLFLMADPGVYKVDIVLDYSLCDGYRDPPKNWFIKGNSQGKMQPNGMLGGRAKKDYLMKKFQDGRDIFVNIPLPKHKGFFFMHTQHERQYRYDPMCQSSCSYMWDGHGRWNDDVWLPYLRAVQNSTVTQLPRKQHHYSTLLIYGDSQADRMHVSLQNSPICKEMFKSCEVRKLWIYPYDSEKPPWDDLDFDHKKLVQDIKEHLEKPEMDANSVFMFNLGLHYLMDISFASYQSLMRDVVDLIKPGSTRYKGKVIWKTITALNKEKDIEDLLYADSKRFLNLPRVELFNSFSTKLMCDAGIEVLDVYPITRGFPEGTGGPEVAHYKEHDIVHFKFYVLKPLQVFLENYFLGQIPYPISFSNYQFL